ncbi:MAG: hypothetical protein ACE5IG_06695 [Dehalococcoidia bacterium]
MPIARLALVRPLPGREQEVNRLQDQLIEAFAQQPGYILGFRFSIRERPRETGRLGIWESLDAADEAALVDHVMSLRSQLNLAISGRHEELIWDLQGSPWNLPAPLKPYAS